MGNRRVIRKGKLTNSCKLDNMVLNNHWVEKEIKMEINTILIQMKMEKESIWDAAKEVLKGKVTTIKSCLKRQCQKHKMKNKQNK